SVYEANQERLKELNAERRAAGQEERRERALTWLRTKVFRNRAHCELNPRFYRNDRVEELIVQFAFWRSQEDLFNHGYLFRHFEQKGGTLPVTLAVWDGGTNTLRPHLDWIRATCAMGR